MLLKLPVIEPEMPSELEFEPEETAPDLISTD